MSEDDRDLSSTYFLERLLVVDRLRPDMKGATRDNPSGEEAPGFKTPLTMQLDVHEELDTLIVSASRGGFYLIEDHQKGEVQTNFFDMPDNEIDVFRGIVDFIYLQGSERNWGNVASCSRVTSDHLESVSTYFSEYGIPFHQIMAGSLGCEQILDRFDIEYPFDGETPPASEKFDEIMSDHFFLGHLGGDIPILYQESLDDYVVCTTEPNFIGQINRMIRLDHANLLIHNPFGLTVTKLNRDD